MRTISSLCLVGALLGTACAPLPPKLSPEIDPVCGFEGRIAFLAIDPPTVRQGSTIAIAAKRDNQPAGEIALGDECVSKWTIAGPARFGRDHKQIIIDPDAPVGSEVVVGFNLGTQHAERRMKVIGRDAVVLTGLRSQVSAQGCPGSPIGELDFRPDSFAVTYRPFESYRDYWGTYSFDPATGALKMVVTGGNKIPQGLDLEGTARIVGERLELDNMYLGDTVLSVPPSGTCKYVF